MIRSWLARHMFYPAQEALRGRDSLRYWRVLEESQWWEIEQLRTLQEHKLAELTAHAGKHTPFYARRFRESGISHTGLRSLDDLRHLPLLTKDDIRNHREEMIAATHTNDVIPSCTSGSTGSPLVFSVGRRRGRSDVASRIRAHDSCLAASTIDDPDIQFIAHTHLQDVADMQCPRVIVGQP